ncbi:hypothetical protein [Oricola sp.]|uniref:hypothetical protein n=1 Tax=Oricola sp. TaxID=1979950 RepID=UPI0025D4C8CC|nr:hypothetical protein [Oricola sp.]MCI5078248.1 hypothetical protein [Oricola sp.]
MAKDQLFEAVPLTPAAEIVLEELAEISLAAKRGGATNDDVAVALLTAFHAHAMRSARRDDFVAMCTGLVTILQRASGEKGN